MDLREHLVNGGRVEREDGVIRLVIPPTTSAGYTDAQLDDYEHDLPRTFVNQPPRHVHIRARFSHPAGAMKGTAGFGFWNHPFTREGGVLEAPQNVWFFYGSPESDMQLAKGVPGHGFKAASLSSSLPGRNATCLSAGFSKVVMAAGNLALRLPVVSSLAMNAARSLITPHERLLNLDMTQWHDYALNWSTTETVFNVDGQEVMRAAKPPQIALGFAAWVDNYRATATPDGQYEFAYVDVPETQWMEMIFVMDKK
jgi:hypothetical protein